MGDITCVECGVIFTLPDAVEEQRRKDHKDFFCPNGHTLGFGGKTREQEHIEFLKARNDELLDEVQYLHDTIAEERKAHASTKGQLTKARKRLASLEATDD